jgi:Carbohydrate binding domain/SdrD B-like domain/Bacterial Ig domain
MKDFYLKYSFEKRFFIGGEEQLMKNLSKSAWIERMVIALGLVFIISMPGIAQTTFTVTNINDSGAGSFRQAITSANSNAGADIIAFNIAGGGVKTISPTSALPTITEAVNINATSQPGYAGAPLIELDGTNAGVGTTCFTISGGNTIIKGFVINRFTGNGISVTTNGGNTIAGNYIGTNSAGTATLGAINESIQIRSANNTVGGASTNDRNIIAGGTEGIRIYGATATGNTIVNNCIGTGVNGTEVLGNTDDGIDIGTSAANNTIGGTTSNLSNKICNNTGDGIEFRSDAGTGNVILGNAIYSNGGNGIDFNQDGVTANDVNDGDTGPNALQNYPVLTSANSTAGGTTIVGTLNSTASTNFRIEFFANSPAIADATNGEGQIYLGYVDVTTNASNTATINTTIPNVWVIAGDRVSATATVIIAANSYGNTSEFSANITATSSFAPGGVTGASIWLKANTGVTTGATLTWADQSGNSRNGVQSTAANQPLLVTNAFNFNPSLLFDGTNDNLGLQNLTGLPTGAAQVEAFSVANNLNIASPWSNIFTYGTGSLSQMFGLAKEAVTTNAATVTWGNDAVSTSGEYAGSRPALLNGKYTGTQVVISSFGVQRATQTSTNNKTTSAGSVGAYPVPSSGAYWNGNIPEIILYPTNLTSLQAQRVNSYLAIKYGITLDQATALNYLASDATVIWNGTTNSGYKNNITGIGRDDLSALNQKQSRSVNTVSSGNLVTIGLGVIAVDNTSNSNTFPADKNFLVWGDNLGSTAIQSTDAPNNTCGRMTRIFKVQETGGEVGNLAVNFDLSALSATYGAYATSGLTLVVSSSASFATPLRSYSAASYTAGIATFTGVDLDNGEFFTLAVRDVNFTPSVSSNSPVCAESAFNLTANGGTTFSWAGPNGFTSTLRNPQSPSIQFADAGTYSVTISNSFGCSAVMTTNVVVDNCSPEVCVQTICNNANATGSITATDADGDVLTNTVTQNPANGTLSIAGSNFTYTPNAGFVGEDQVTIQSCDPSSACVLCVKKFVVQACNIVPVCGTANTLTTCMGASASGTLNATAPNGLPITYTIVSQPSSGTVSLAGAVYTYTPVQGFQGSVVWAYRATTATGSVDCRVTIYVENCFSVCDGNGCAANIISGGTYPTSGSTLFSLNNVNVTSNSNYCYSISLTNQCAACATTAKVNFYAGTVLLGTINYDELPLNVATVKGFSFNTAQLGNPATINFSVTHSGFGTPGTNIVAANASLKIITAAGVPVANNDEGILICKNSGAYTAAVLSNDLNVSATPTLTLITALPGATGTASVVGQSIVFTPNASFVGTANITYQICNGACCDQAVLTIQVVEPAVTVSSATICQNETKSLYAAVAGIDTALVAYQWQISTNNSTFTNINGATSNIFTTAALVATTYYRVVITAFGNGCTAVTSATSTITVNTCVEICTNGLDDDGDGLIDCADSDCANSNFNFGACTSVLNPGFESNLTSWTVAGTAASSADAHSGTKSVLITGASSGIDQSFNITVGQVYRLEAWGKKDGTNWAGFGIDWLNASNSIIHTISTEIEQGGWRKNSVVEIAPVGAVKANVWAYTDGGMNAWFDDFCFSTNGATSLTRGNGTDILVNSGFEQKPDTLTFPINLAGNPSRNISNTQTGLIPGWEAAVPNGKFAFYVDDRSNLVNNPEGNFFIWMPDINFCWATVSSMVNTPLVNGKSYTISLYAAPWEVTLGGNNLPNGAAAVQGMGKLSLEFAYDNISNPGVSVTEWNIPASTSWNSMNWKLLTYTFTYDASHPVKKIYLTNVSGKGMAIDAMQIRENISCVENCTDGIDNDSDGLMDCADPDCPACAYTLGNRVFRDLDNDGIFEFANGEIPIDGVKMNLYADDGDGSLDAGDGAPLATQVTHNGGYYSFRNLAAGNYIVEVAANNFVAGAALYNMVSSAGAVIDPDNNVDGDDNGTAVAGYGVASLAITLGGSEPTMPADENGASGNTTLDFGFHCTGTLDVDALVSNHLSDKISRFDFPSGTAMTDFIAAQSGGVQRPYDFAFGPDGDLFVTSSFTDQVIRYNNVTGAPIGAFVTAGSGGLDEPKGLAFGPDGNLYVTSFATNQVKRYNGTTGAFIDNFITAAGGLSGPHQGIAFGPDGYLYVSSYTGNQIRRYNGSTGAYVDNIAITTPRGFAFGPDGFLYVANHTSSIYKINTTSLAVTTFNTATFSEYYAGIAFGTDGKLYAPDLSGNQVRRFNYPAGTNAGVFATGGLGEPKNTVFNCQCAIAVENCTNGIDDDGDGLVDCDDPDCNLVSNGEFNSGTTGWQLHVQSGNTATLSVANTSLLSGVNSGLVDLTTATGTEWHVQLAQHGKSIVAGQTYTVSFQAKAAASRNASLMLQRTTSPYNSYWNQTFALTTSPQSYSYTFVVDSTNTGLVGLYFNLAANNSDVWIDNVKFTRSCAATEICGNGIDDDGDGSIDADDNECFACTAGILANPDFNQNMDYWTDWGNTTIVSQTSGNKYAHVSGGYGGFGRDYPTTPGTTFSLTFKARASAGEPARSGIRFFDTGFNLLGYEYGYAINSTNFKQYQVAAVAPANTAYVQIFAWKDDNGGTADFDGYCLKLTTENCTNGVDDDGDGLNNCADPDCPCSNVLAVGNMVYIDADNDKAMDAGEGVNGVQLRLFFQGNDPLVATPVATTTTANGGKYLFDNLVPGNYFIHIPKAEFASGKPLFGRVSVDGDDGDYGVDDQLSENGSDNPDPSTQGMRSGVFTLAYGSEPVNAGTELGSDNTADDANDPSDDDNTDLTIDFGFATPTPCSMTISQAKATPCYKNNSGNYVTDIEVTVYWSGFIDGDTIKVSMNGVSDQFAPYNEQGGIIQKGVQHFFLRGVTSSGGTATVNAQFVVRSGCSAAKSVAMPSCNCPAGQLAGTAWQDFDNNGIQEAHETAGVAGVTVMAYDCNGTLVGTTMTNSSGQFTFNGLTNGNKYRIEFSTVSAPYFPTEIGLSNGTNVQFITAPSCNINFGLNNPEYYCQENPLVGVPCYVNGLASAPGVAAHDAFVLLPYDATATYNVNTGQIERTVNPTHASTIGEIGSTWGVAYQRSTKTMFTSAVIKRHAGLGPLGTGGIYKINALNPAAPTTANWIDVRTLGVDTGTDPRDGSPGNTLPNATTTPSYDLKAYDAVGKKGIGDIDYDEARNTLWFVNLYERTLVGINNVNPNASPTAGNVVEYPISLPAGYSCGTNGDLRPWGLKVHEGRVYIGIICTNQGADWYNATGLRAFVISFNPSTPAAGFRYETDIDMSYDKVQYGVFKYNNWVPSVANLDYGLGYTTPILSDIEFDLDGSMILGIADRLGLQSGYYNYAPDETMTDQFLYATAQSGDLLRLCKIGNNFVLPGSDPACPLLGVVHGDGINGGEHYWADWGPHVNQKLMADNGFNETAMGAIAFNRSAGEVMSTQTDPTIFHSGGIMTYSNVTGGDMNAFTLYVGVDDGGQGKTTGLGDIELLCNIQPIEIGNYVWLDEDDDGIQDACEPPLDSVKVSLYKPNGLLIGQTTTNASGNYAFNETNVDTLGFLNDNIWTGLSANANYVIVVGNANNNGVVFANGKLTVNGIQTVLTFPNIGQGANPDLNDSDGTILSGLFAAANGFPGLAITTPAKGSLHNQDFGFRPLCENFSVFAGTDVTICAGNSTSLTATGYGGLVPYTFAWSNGLGAGATKTVTPAGTTTYTVTITDADGCTRTDQVTVFITVCTEACGDGIDNDSDSLVDCADPDCAAVGQPNLANDTYQTCPGETFQEQPIFNDGNIQFPSYSIYTPATKGTVTINTQGVFTYTPFNSSCGLDSFRYQICNIMSGCCDHATVILQIGDNQPPVLQNLPADITISCSEPIPAAPVVFGVDACPGIYVTFDETNNQTSTGSCQNYNIVRTWTAYDRCGNYAVGKQTITVADEIEPEIFRIYTLENGNKLLAGIAQKVKTGWTRVKFPIAFDAPPVVFAQVVSTNGSEPIAIRVKAVDEEGFFVKVQEQEQADGIHAVEQVAWMATETGATADAAKLHIGIAAGITHATSTINYGLTYSTAPVFIAVPQSNNEADPFTVRFPMQGTSSAQVMLQEEQSKDAEMLHVGESLAWLSLNAGSLTDFEGSFIGVAGTVSVGNVWVTVPLPRKFSKPVVLFGGQASGNDPATVRVKNVTSNSFQVRIEEWPYLNNLFTNRTLSYLVVEGSIPAAILNPCDPETISLLPGVNLFAVDDCDNQVTLDYSESSALTPAGLVKTNIWVAADDCGNANTLVRNDTCNMAAVKVRAVLGGGLIGILNSNLMRDNLRSKQYLPTTSPYKDAMGNFAGQANDDAISSSLLEITGPNAIVDWVLVELRDSGTPTKVKGAKSALLLRNGNVINPDGTDIILFDTTVAGSYYICLKHRNHLGIMTENARFLNALSIPVIDFTSTLEPLNGGMNATRIVDGTRRIWSGDLTGDGRVIYQGPGNDVFKLFYDIMGHPDNTGNLANFIRSGYEAADVNLDGNAIYQGPVNDRSMLLQHTILAHSGNALFLSNYIAYAMLP